MAKVNPLPVEGYTSQSEDNITEVNWNKVLEERVLRRIDSLLADGRCDQRLAALARTNIEQAFMWLNRAIFRPDRIRLPEDD